jgi:hypothetical protein
MNIDECTSITFTHFKLMFEIRVRHLALKIDTVEYKLSLCFAS